MQYQTQSVSLSEQVDALLIGVYEEQVETPSFAKLNELSQNYLRHLYECGDISAKVGQVTLLHNVPNIAAKRLIIVGFGKKDELNVRQFKQSVQAVAQTIKSLKITELVSNLHEVTPKDRDLYWSVRFFAETFDHSNYQFTSFKTSPLAETTLQRVLINCDDTQANLAIAHANAINAGVKAARDVANMPPNVCNPLYLAEQAKLMAAKFPGVLLEVIDESKMAELGMNAYLAVSRGSSNPAAMSILQFNNAPDKNAKPIVLVGKGLTFDAGGISLKPAADMDEMKYDMGGAAAVFGTMYAIAQLNLPLNVIGVLAGCENLPDGNAYRPGDILRTMNGLTVEVLNTDAEGRLVLCDALTYVERFEPELVIDVATLTGACVVALGQHNSGLISSDENLAQDLLQSAQQTQDKAWRLPLSEEYQEQLKSPFADLANIGGRWGGASTAGAFLSNFTQKYRWAHLDIAGTAWLQGANKGATGRPVPLLTQFLINQAK